MLGVKVWKDALYVILCELTSSAGEKLKRCGRRQSRTRADLVLTLVQVIKHVRQSQPDAAVKQRPCDNGRSIKGARGGLPESLLPPFAPDTLLSIAIRSATLLPQHQYREPSVNIDRHHVKLLTQKEFLLYSNQQAGAATALRRQGLLVRSQPGAPLQRRRAR
jgi:hypothetical protein